MTNVTKCCDSSEGFPLSAAATSGCTIGRGVESVNRKLYINICHRISFFLLDLSLEQLGATPFWEWSIVSQISLARLEFTSWIQWCYGPEKEVSWRTSLLSSAACTICIKADSCYSALLSQSAPLQDSSPILSNVWLSPEARKFFLRITENSTCQVKGETRRQNWKEMS